MSEGTDAMLRLVDDLQEQVSRLKREADENIALRKEIQTLRHLLQAYKVDPEAEAAFRAAERKFAEPRQ